MTDLTPQPQALPPDGQGGFRVYPDATQAYDVALGATGAKQINVIKVIRELTGWDLKTAKVASEQTPTLLLQNVPSALADEAARRLAAAGATPIKVPAGEPLPALAPGLFTPTDDQAVVPWNAPDPVRSQVARPAANPHRLGLVAVIVAAFVALAVGLFGFRAFTSSTTGADPEPAPPVQVEDAAPGVQGADLTGADMSNTVFNEYDFGYAIIVDADFSNSTLNNASFSYADGTGADFSNVTANGAHFYMAGLTDAEFRNAVLNAAEFSFADLTGADFSNAELAGADFTNAILIGARLANADLTGANLVNADLTGADLSNADFRGALYSDETIWPAGFVPPANAVHN